MSVYIKGMTMPKNCINCPLTVGAYDCGVTGENVIDFLDKKPPNCPLVELPPHGRLIDADALKWIEGKDEQGRPVFLLLKCQCDEIPTIIEADGEE